MKERVLKSALFLCTIFLASCAGYHFNTNNNPLIGFDIKSVSVPVFINRSTIPNLSTYMSKEIILAMTDYSGLKVYGGDRDDTDAVLIGILESKDQYLETFKPSEYQFTDSTLKSSIGNRAPFYYSTKTTYNFTLRVILIKRPTKQEIELLTSELGAHIKVHPKVVLNETLSVSGDFTRAASSNTGNTSGGSVNFTKNQGLLRKSLQDIAIDTATNFKQVVLNAF